MSSGRHQNDGSGTESLLLNSNRGRGLDILKSIVYGGLLECIRSLSVISSVACSGASASIVVALGVAIMVSDIIIFAQNFLNLYKGDSINSAQDVDPYEELLGNRGNSELHAIVSLISFCVFGLIPSLVYFFSFSQTDDNTNTLKLISAFMASLLCIVLLAVGESCARNQPESCLQTVVNYADLAIKSSAVYHLVRNLAPDLIKDNQQSQHRTDEQEQPIMTPTSQVDIGDCTAADSIENELGGSRVGIVKGIVDLGLAECITSLGVVSFAAASGASTRTILALAFANLLPGLAVIVYSLQELKKKYQEDMDDELLGRRQNFLLHVVISIISLLLFGLIPPLFYVVFDDNKLLPAFAASLVCVLLLALGKAWVVRPRIYIKSMLYYGIIAVGLSGISFVVGYLVGESLK